MPYINQQIRHNLQDLTLREILHEPRAPLGEITYIIYALLVSKVTGTVYEADFATRASLLGAVEAAKLEFYRRHVAPYEDKKLGEHGDV